MSAGHNVIALDRGELDICSPRQVVAVTDHVRPQAIINCASYNAVDAAETDQRTAFAVNSDGPALLAAAADSIGAVLVHFSTDYVFDGEAWQAYTETEQTNPVNVYGASKMTGEVAAQRVSRHYVLRVSSLFGGKGLNGHRATVDYIADTLLAGAAVQAAVDRIVTPSYAPDVAMAVVALLGNSAPYGTYHCVSSTSTSWYELAEEISRRIGLAACIEPVRAADLKTVARRPRFCALSNQKLASVGITMPSWQSAISRHVTSQRAALTTASGTRS